MSDFRMRHSVTVIQDAGGDVTVPLPDELLDELGWSEGDDLELEIENDDYGDPIIVVRKIA